MKRNQKILVIGAGIAGPAICYWLKRYGFNPTLIERSQQLRTGGYDIDIRGIALDVVKAMGLYDDIFAKRTSILTTRYVDADNQVLSEQHGEKAVFKEGDDVEILRGDLAAILLQAIPDIPCHFHKEITSLKQNEPVVEVTFNDGHIECYDLVIAADGLHSSTRKMTFVKDEYEFFHLGYYISVFSISNYLHLKKTKVTFTKDQKIISVDSDKDPDRAFVSVGVRSDKVLSDIGNEKGQKQCLRDWLYDLGWESNEILSLMNTSDDFYFDVMAQIKMDSWAKGRVALVGDAAYCASPFSGMGINLSLVGAYILAGELNLSEGDYPVAFRRYNERMRPFVDANQDLALWMGECFLPKTDVSKKILEQRSQVIMAKIKVAANAISLPEYV